LKREGIQRFRVTLGSKADRLKRRRVLLAVAVVFIIVSLVVALMLVWHSNSPARSVAFAYEVKDAFPNLAFDRPVGIYDANDGSNRLFVISQAGVIYVFNDSADASNTSVFLDLRDRVTSEGSEEGLLGLAFHPNFTRNGLFYVDYTAADPTRVVIARFSVNASNRNIADSGSEKVLLEVSKKYSNHNGGQIAFGADGYLYVGVGDGGSEGDPDGNGQNRLSLLGKILRINVDAEVGSQSYGIPVDNPFVGNNFGYREEIYAYGFRNPWRFSFDPVTNLLWVGDVGQDRVEEIDLVKKGGNYGWNIMEGNQCYAPPQNCNTTGLELPIWQYYHEQGNDAIIGGFVYRGSELSLLVGSYVYGDYGSGRIWSLKYDEHGPLQNLQLVKMNTPISSFGIDRLNRLYVCSLNGKIYTLVQNKS
jgi:glucose/arabinose dehydrogenase